MFLQLYIDLQIMQKYKKLELIGEGSFGSVYTIQNERNEIFALKTIQVDPFAVDQSQREIQMMKIFSHQSLVKIYDYSLTQDNELHIVMEYCENGDLQKYFQSKDKKLPPQEILSIFRQIVKAFVLMSVKGVIHRDIKPQNIMMIKNSIIKIADFGCARCIGEMEMSKIDNFSMDKGTFLYASPQQLKNQPYSFKCDVWAAGCIAYLLNFGVHPFLDSKPHFTLQKIKALTQGKVIQTHNCDLSIAQFIKLSLIYSDQERASWRQLWLCRIFAPKIKAIKEYLTYLKNLSAIASWITKQFWKVRKQFNISKNSDEIFIYFLIKFQMTNLKLALKILKKSQQYEYLFDEKSFNDYQPNEEQFNQIKKAYIEHEKYYTTVKKTMQSKDSFKQIEQREIVRTSSFADLSQSIRAGYKILKEVIPKLQSPEKKDKVWQIMAAWVNFEGYFSYEKNPNPDKFSQSGYINIGEQLIKYQQGIVQ